MNISQGILQRFEIRTPLSSGAQAKVCVAWDKRSGEIVFLKIINAAQLGEWKTWELFQRESQTLQKLKHPQIPAYIDSFQDEEANFCLVQKYIDAPSIAKLLANKRIFQSIEVIDIGLQVLEILNYLKNCDPPVVHRDIKPSNMLYGDDNKVYLVDFGLVAAPSDVSERGSTIAGTAGYMAPEQLMGDSKPASDIFGLFTTLLHLLTGTPPSTIPTVGFEMQIRPYLKELPYDLVLLFEECLQPLISKRQSDIPYIRRELLHIKDILQNNSCPRPWPDTSHDVVPRKTALSSKSKKIRKYASPIKTLYRSRYYSPLKPGLQHSIPDNNEFSYTFCNCRNIILNFEETSLEKEMILPDALTILIFVLFFVSSVFMVLNLSYILNLVSVMLLVISLISLFGSPLIRDFLDTASERRRRNNIEEPLKKITPLSSTRLLTDNLTIVTEGSPQNAIIRNIELIRNTLNSNDCYLVTIQTPHPRKPAELLTLQKDLAFNSLDTSLNIGDEVPIRIDNNGDKFVFFPGPFFE